MSPHTLDRRRHAYRPDLADARLDGRVSSRRFVAGVPRQIRHATAPMRATPDAAAGLDNEALFGEPVSLFEEAGGWAWVQLERDGYVGYVPAETLAADVLASTHRVQCPGTFVYSEPSIKRPPLAHLSLNAYVTAGEPASDERFIALVTGGYVYARHLAAVGTHARDFVDVAEQLIHTPYLWGGRTRLGLDCSALVQLALEAAGRICPRDSDMAAVELGTAVLVPADLEGLRRGDIVYWPGHCGIMIDSVMLLHANGHHMATVIEPLSQVARRNRKAGGAGAEISGIRRLLPEVVGAT